MHSVNLHTHQTLVCIRVLVSFASCDTFKLEEVFQVIWFRVRADCSQLARGMHTVHVEGKM